MDIKNVIGLYEARKNPDKNPKISVMKRLEERIKSEGSASNLYVSFYFNREIGN